MLALFVAQPSRTRASKPTISIEVYSRSKYIASSAGVRVGCANQGCTSEIEEKRYENQVFVRTIDSGQEAKMKNPGLHEVADE